MARAPRIQFDGANYHVINRGNYRKDLFANAGTAEAFERTLFETCSRCGWPERSRGGLRGCCVIMSGG